MSPEVLIVGQGLAGSLLGWELEKAGVRFAIADAGHAWSATAAAAAGIVNPITGRRLVKTWQAETLLPLARETYRELGETLAVPLWTPMRVRRLFADDRERATFATKARSGELTPFAGEGDADGFWIEDAARVDLRALLFGLRERWRRSGVLRAERVDVTAPCTGYTVTIDCTGLEGARGGAFGFVPWEFSKGEVLEIAIEGLAPGVVVNRRHWVMPVSATRAWVGATHEPGVVGREPTAAGRAVLEASARELVGKGFSVAGHFAGVRVNLPDKRPVAGRHPSHLGLGTINGLGAKGVMLAPWLARAWAAHLRGGAAFSGEVDVRRFGG